MERYRELRALLRLLTHLTQRDLVDFGTAEGEATVDVAQVVVISRVVSCSLWRQSCSTPLSLHPVLAQIIMLDLHDEWFGSTSIDL